MTNEERERRIEQLADNIRGARAKLPSSYVRTCLPHFAPTDEAEAWLRAKIEEWRAEIKKLHEELEHGWECSCPRCYFGRLELELTYGPAP